ncbi:MAG: sigma-54-dependent Fis family transcriptional regulator [Syntrophomonadaceae bacterium]|nr:sigma-54-dependent Fis family transcriptional regulator [Syntrophomonadaceae bacterium]
MASGIEMERSEDTLIAAWKKFIQTGTMEQSAVRPEIRQSWQRCYDAGVDPYDGTSHLILKKNELERLRLKNKELMEVAWQFMVRLYEFVAGSGFVVFLSDERGFILESIGDYGILDDASKVNLITGTGWMEEEVGTNGIGTTLKLKQPVQVSGQEHYCKMLHSWTCSAAPIGNDDGQIIGALQMSGPSSAVHLHTLGMVVAAVEAIQDQIRIKQQNQELTVLNSSLQNIFQTMSDGAIMIDRQAIIKQINPVGEKILSSDLIGRPIEYLFGETPKTRGVLDKGETYTDVEVRVDTPQNYFHCLVTGKPIKDEKGEVTGAVIFFNPINKVKRLINRFSGAEATFHFEDIIGESPRLREAIKVAVQAAANTSNVLIVGESGTGKELFAQAIHNYSEYQKGPFVALNCAAIPRELIASELFGYSEGAFTGARRGGRPGKFEMASGGTLFLDEIGDMPLDQQVTLLRVLQERKIIRIGGEQVIPVDVRVICATNKNLKEEVKKGNFRQELYYRLNVILISVPPLRDRIRDISILFYHFVNKIANKLNTHIDYIEPGIIECLQQHNWPGNVRELENIVEKMINISGDTRLKLEHLPPEIAGLRLSAQLAEPLPAWLPSASEAAGEAGGMTVLLAERDNIIELLARHKGNVSRIAAEMGVSRNTIYRKMKFYNISREYNFE